jgi:hypothetical protein
MTYLELETENKKLKKFIAEKFYNVVFVTIYKEVITEIVKNKKRKVIKFLKP